MSKTKNNPPFPLRRKKFDYDKMIREAGRIAREVQEERRKEGLKHCRCCPAHLEYQEMNHEAYQ
jgi:hypothetical protein